MMATDRMVRWTITRGRGRRRSAPEGVPALARWLLGPGITTTLTANAVDDLGYGLIGAAMAAWPAALVGS